MCIREPGPNELVPAVLQEGSHVKEFDQLFFIVNLSQGKVDPAKDYNILKINDFPAFNRGAPPTMGEYKGFLKKYAKESKERRFSDFNFLLFVATIMGAETAVTMAQLIEKELPQDDGLISLLNSM